MASRIVKASGLLLACVMAASSSGCVALGWLAAGMPKPDIKASYSGLPGQTVAVMVWVDRGIRIDNPSLALDIANGVQGNLKQAVKDKKEEVKNVTFPIDPRSILKYQAEHPEIDVQEVTKTAAILNVTRVIYIEVNDFATRPNAQVELFRGTADVNIQVVEIDAAGHAKVALRQSDIRITPDKKAPAMGMPNSSDQATYQLTVETLTKEVAERFYTHDSPEN